MSLHGIEDIYELSPMQAGMLFHSVYEAGPRMYFEQVVIPVEAAIDEALFAQSWAAVSAAHPALRSSIHWEDLDKPVQVVHRDARVAVETWDLRREPASQREALFRRKLAADRDRGFRLDRAPLMRVALARFGPARFRMVLSFHHIILDGWSLQAVFVQFSETYARLAAGGRPVLPETRPYRAFIEWLQAQDPAEARRYWRTEMAGAPGPSGIGDATFGAGAAMSDGPDDFGEVAFRLTQEETEAIRAACVARHLTLNTVLQGAWAITLGRTTGRKDLVFGVTVSGRPAEIAGVEEMIGLFINTVPLRTRLSYATPVADWLSRLQSDQLRARSYDHCGLVQIRDWAGLPGDEELFDTILAFENYPTQRKAGQGVTETTFIERTNYPLSIAVIPGDGLQFRLLHDGRAMAPARVRAIGDALRAALLSLTRALAGPPGATLDDVVHAAWPVPARAAPSEPYPAVSLPRLFDTVAEAFPEAVAVESPAGPMTYAALHAEARDLAARLVASGVRRGDRVALMLGDAGPLVTAMLAVLTCGAAYVPLDPAAPPERVATILRDVGAALILTDAAQGAAARAHGVAVTDITAKAPEAPRAALPAPPGPMDVAYVMFTSGSTGEPKGIEIPHRAIVRLVRNTDYVDLGPDDRIACHSNVAFDAATFEIWGALLNGGAAVALDRDTMLSPDALARALAEQRISTLFLTTALFNRIALEKPDAFRGLDTLLFGGEAADAGAVRAVLEGPGPGRLLHVYGPTESTTFATWQHLTALGPGDIPPIGEAIAHTTAHVLDAQLRPVPPGAAGELFLGGDGLAHGYAGRPALTARSFVPDPFSGRPGARLYRTGDRVMRDAEGRLVFLDRLDTQIKLRGYRIELREIEARLRAEPAVTEAAVICTGEGASRAILAYVAPANAPTEALRAALARQMPAYALPEAIVALDRLPLNRNGKVDRAALPRPHQRPAAPDRTAQAPTGATEARLMQIWAAVLDHDGFGPTDNFFDIGGHSLRVTQLASRIKRHLGVDLALRVVFDHPTVAALARIIDAGAAPVAGDAQAGAAAPEAGPDRRKGGIKAVSRSARARNRTTGA